MKSRLAVLKLLALCGGISAAAAAEEEAERKEIRLPKHKLNFVVPDGWRLVKLEQEKNDASFVLQYESKESVKPTIVVLAGPKYVKEAPGSGNIRGGNAIAGSIWASQKAASWAKGNPDQPPGLPEVAHFKSATYATKSFLRFEVTVEGIEWYGLSADHKGRIGGALMVGSACLPADREATLRVMGQIFVGGKTPAK